MTSLPNMNLHPQVQSFFDSASNTISYLVQDPASNSCAVIDPVLDFDYAAGRISTQQADEIIITIKQQQLKLEWIIDTHAHADHLSAALYIQKRLGGKLGIGQHITQVQQTFADIFNEDNRFCRKGSQFDHLFADGETYQIGTMTAFTIHAPGHTPACMVHVIGDAAFVGDTLFMPDAGSARADFPGGDAGQLYDSIQKILALPDEMRLFMCHDYGADGREIAWETTVAEQKANNIHIAHKTRAEFIVMREARDATLDMPKLIYPALQVNIRAGDLPPAEDNGRHYLKVPLES